MPHWVKIWISERDVRYGLYKDGKVIKYWIKHPLKKNVDGPYIAKPLSIMHEYLKNHV